jgi:heptosyltransferase II
MRTIAVFLPNWIGDVVMATPAIAALHRSLAASRLVAVGRPYVADVVAGAPWFSDDLLFEKRGLIATARRLRAINADAAVLFPNSLRAAVVARLGGCRIVAGFARYGRDALLTHRLYARRNRIGGHQPSPVVDDYNRIVQALGVPDPGHRLTLHTTPQDEHAASRVWQNLRLHRFGRVIGLNPGGAFGAAKHWPTEHFAHVARRFAERGAGVIVLCGPSEREEANRIAAAAGHDAVASLASESLSIGLSKAIVRRLDLLITTDSGPRHFAHAFDVPVVSLFGPTHIAWTETRFEKAIHLQNVLPCGPCQQRSCPLGHHDCMTRLLPDSVVHAGQQLLHRYPITPEARNAG